jgi:amino acid transporter
MSLPLKQDSPVSQVSKGNLGTFAGVFTPSILTILGIILFLRLGYVVGSAGLARALVIIALANAISVLTSISLSAIATNLKVKGGGDYYLISRTLGVEFGGAIGIVLFLAQSVSIAFYCIGFGEAMGAVLPDSPRFSPQIIAVFAVSSLFILAWLGADWATRFQYVVMALLFASLLSFFSGGLTMWNSATFAENWAGPAAGPGFWVLFAIFFPAVTGFTQGVSMSGDLKDPGKSLPLGTFLAVGISIVVYFAVAVVFGASSPSDTLAGDYGAMRRVARFGFLIDAGVIAATLSSAMASFLGAPRILQSLSADRIFPFLLPFSKGSGTANNPRRGVLLSAGIAFTTIGLGNLNVIARLVSMFFLISYGLLNYATFYEARAESPSFRPRFRWFDLRISLLGFLTCLGVMLAIDPTAGAVAISLLFAIFQYLKRTAGPARWADSRRSYHLQRVRENLLAAYREPEHPRDWRPQLLAFSDNSERRGQLLRFAEWIQGGSGLITAVRILEGEGLKMLKLRSEAEAELQADIEAFDMPAFPLVVVAPNLQLGVQSAIQAFGVGPIKANTILLNWFEELPRGILGLRGLTFGRNLRAAFRLGCNIIVLNAGGDAWRALEHMPPGDRRIDVWWRDDATGRLMLLLTHLMKRREEWKEAGLRILAGAAGKSPATASEALEKALYEARIEAETKVMADPDDTSIVRYSADAAMVFLPFRLQGNQMISPFGNGVEDLVSRLPVVSLVLAAEDIDLDAEPEEGKAGEMAAALDALAAAQDKALKAEKALTKAADFALEAGKKLERKVEAASPGADREAMKAIEKAAHEADAAKAETEKAARRAAKAKAKADDAAREAEAAGAKDPEKKS